MKHYLWIGSFSTKEVNVNLQKKGYKNAAQYVAQRNILEGLESAWDCTFDTIGAIGFPDDSKLKYIRKIEFSHKNNANDVLVGYLNMKYANRVFSAYSVDRTVRKYLKKLNDTDELIVVMYEMRSLCYKVAETIKKKKKNVKIIMVVPDLPMYMSGKYSWIKRYLKKIDIHLMNNRKKYIDKYVLFTETMASYLQIDKEDYCIMEGSIHTSDIENSKRIQSECRGEKIIIMYSGIIDESYGILNLMYAFRELSSKYELWITGGGVSEKKVISIASRTDNIKYYGFLSTRDEVIKLQQKATALINLRNPKEKSSEFCFPSKLFEYMLSGKPVISTKTKGIPDEYFKYLIPIEDIAVDSIKNGIEKIDSMSIEQRNDFARQAQYFIVHNKNNKEQATKIAELI